MTIELPSAPLTLSAELRWDFHRNHLRLWQTADGGRQVAKVLDANDVVYLIGDVTVGTLTTTREMGALSVYTVPEGPNQEFVVVESL